MSLPLHQATCVAIEERAVLIEGPPGAGKSSLALALIDRGAILVSDDGVAFEVSDDRLLASAPPQIAGLIEVRNLGLLPYPTVSMVPVALVLRLDETAPRFIQEPSLVTIAGLNLPMVQLWPGPAVLPLRAELALLRYGLR
jgi:serine kinase of HPr protein (carbohydrate metabolism regulator)